MFSDHKEIKLETNNWKSPKIGKLANFKITHGIKKEPKGNKVFYTKWKWKYNIPESVKCC